MSGTTSNNGSDFECVDNDNQDIDNVPIDTVAGSDPVLNYIMSFSDIGEAVVTKFKEQKISFNQLANLTDNDLKIMGVKSENTRRKMIEEFAKLPSQDESSYNMRAQRLDLQLFHSKMIEDMEEHITNLKQMVSAGLLKFHINPPVDVVVEDSTYSSALLYEICCQMSKKSESLQRAIDCLKNPDYLKEAEVARKRAKFTKILFGAIGFTMLGIALFKSKDKLFSL